MNKMPRSFRFSGKNLGLQYYRLRPDFLADSKSALSSFTLSGYFEYRFVVSPGSSVRLVSWPVEAIVEAVIQGYFTTGQAFAPAVMLVYATALFLLASDLFARKDLFLTED